MSFIYERTIRLADTDAAGVVFFANTLALCHEAYEAALAAAGCPVADFLGRDSDVLIPIAKASTDYLRPLFCGDLVRITLRPTRLSEESFAIDYEIVGGSGSVRRPALADKAGALVAANASALGAAEPRPKVAARARTEHVATSRSKRCRIPVPEKLAAWVDAL
ncbi:hypothetical protein AXK12_01435 [Cephaloticoccus capnophilus]|uniref:Uncharacterized protein n=1 Tax=Cephaloticoccus capnophilus TaxID=1548208 RepID=A0A139SSS8_9BACT|nr:thioesterase family protein [Cephaloticoccus capnophilus]KXU37629.1 hypothetical protein AXK12_01435 [Cephaloticoccus capnophilus]